MSLNKKIGAGNNFTKLVKTPVAVKIEVVSKKVSKSETTKATKIKIKLPVIVKRTTNEKLRDIEEKLPAEMIEKISDYHLLLHHSNTKNIQEMIENFKKYVPLLLSNDRSLMSIKPLEIIMRNEIKERIHKEITNRNIITSFYMHKKYEKLDGSRTELYLNYSTYKHDDNTVYMFVTKRKNIEGEITITLDTNERMEISSRYEVYKSPNNVIHRPSDIYLTQKNNKDVFTDQNQMPEIRKILNKFNKAYNDDILNNIVFVKLTKVKNIAVTHIRVILMLYNKNTNNFTKFTIEFTD